MEELVAGAARPTRVLMTADSMGGVWTYALELVRALSRHGVVTTLATVGRQLSSEQRRAAHEVPGLDLRESTLRLEWMEDPWEDVARAGEWLQEIAAETRPDLVHLNDYAHGALPWRAPVLVVGHSCVLSWWRAVKGCEAPREWDRYRTAVRQGLRGADLVIAPSRAMLESLAQLYGPLPAAGVVANGRDPSFVEPGRKEDFVLCAGRLWDEAKNLGALERASRQLRWPVYAAGEGCEPEAQNGFGVPGVRPLGLLASGELRSWLARAAIYALPARYEPFGLSVLEAALAGCALVLGDVPSLRENWEGAARFVDPEDIGALAGTLRELCGDAAERRVLGANARARALQLSPARMAEGYIAAYGWLLTAAARSWREHACAS